jgi:hypothetical protein
MHKTIRLMDEIDALIDRMAGGRLLEGVFGSRFVMPGGRRGP